MLIEPHDRLKLWILISCILYFNRFVLYPSSPPVHRISILIWKWLRTLSTFIINWLKLTMKTTVMQYKRSFNLKTGQNNSRIQLSRNSESHHRSRSRIATPMMVLYKTRGKDLGAKWPSWKTKFARNFCEVIARKKRAENPHSICIEIPLRSATGKVRPFSRSGLEAKILRPYCGLLLTNLTIIDFNTCIF